MAAQPITDDSNYLDRYVAFLDILGFSQLTTKADRHPNWRAYLRDCINSLNQTLPTHSEQTGMRFLQFSDSIVISVLRNPLGLATLCNGVSMLVNNMLSRQILLRGGIAAGNFHHDDHVIFGPALIRAYEFEQHGAPPHIGIHADVLEDMKASVAGPSLEFFVARDPWDLSPMLNTLLRFQQFDGILRAGHEDLFGLAFSLAQSINLQARNMNHPPSVRAKWRWMQDYWNQMVESRGLLTLSLDYHDWEAVRQEMLRKSKEWADYTRLMTLQPMAPPPPPVIGMNALASIPPLPPQRQS